MDQWKMIDGLLKSLLETTGGMREVNLAIDSKDLAATVRAATGVLKKTLSIPMRVIERKSAEMSNQLRKEGNLHYINQDHKQAIFYFNKALAYAPNNSIELKLAYGNISAVLFTIKAFQACQMNIEAALNLDCPAFLRVKLEKREKETHLFIMLEMMKDVIIRADRGMRSYVEFDVKKNAKIPCASMDVHVTDDKKVVAANDIKSGTMVAMEKAFVSVQDPDNEYTSCYYCHRMNFFFVPCEGCCKALFCSVECRTTCLEEYHRIECHILAYMGTMFERSISKLAVRAAIKMSLKLSWEELRVASLEMGQERLKKSPMSEAFDVNNPVSLLCYNDQVTVERSKMVQASLLCASVVHCLDNVPDYLPEDEIERELATDTLSRIILHLNTTFLRDIGITSSAYDYLNDTLTCGAQRNIGWFSFASKLPNCCEPNLLVVGFNDHVGLIAIQRIKKGDRLTIAYFEHFYELNMSVCPKNFLFRQKQIQANLQELCECRVCLEEWHNKSHSEAKLTSSQEKAYNQYKAAMKNVGFNEKMKGISAGLDALTDCPNTTQHYNLYGDLRRILNSCQVLKHLNKTYGQTSAYTFAIRK